MEYTSVIRFERQDGLLRKHTATTRITNKTLPCKQVSKAKGASSGLCHHACELFNDVHKTRSQPGLSLPAGFHQSGVVVRAVMSSEGRPGSARASMGCREKPSSTR